MNLKKYKHTMYTIFYHLGKNNPRRFGMPLKSITQANFVHQDRNTI